jgi:hypothetical protein
MYIPKADELQKLFHGTNSYFDSIDLAFSEERKDFGKGFYTTTNYGQAQNFAGIKARRSDAKTSSRYVMELQISQEKLKALNLNILRFSEPDAEWVNFILCNRYPEEWTPPFSDNYDMAIGPVADMAAGRVFNALLAGAYGDPSTARAIDMLILNLNPQVLENQVVFLTERSLDCITNRDELAIQNMGEDTYGNLT